MKIKTKLQVSAALSISITLVISLVLHLAYRDVDKAIRQTRAVYGTVQSVFELNLLLNDFMLRHDKEAEAGWQAKHEALGKLLGDLTVTNDQERLILNKVRANHAAVAALFSQLVSGNEEQRRDRNEIISFLDLEEKVVGQLSDESKAMVSHAAGLAELTHARAMATQQTSSMLVIIFAALATAVLAITLMTIAAAVVKPITRLKEATGIIAGGSWNHKVEITSDDEIGQLSAAFNRMTAKLKDSYVAIQDSFDEMSRKLRNTKKDLEKEIKAREQAEEELKKLR
jgi:nitrogen fixation/metabolism regulation signal transduction histidine kinase